MLLTSKNSNFKHPTIVVNILEQLFNFCWQFAAAVQSKLTSKDRLFLKKGDKSKSWNLSFIFKVFCYSRLQSEQPEDFFSSTNCGFASTVVLLFTEFSFLSSSSSSSSSSGSSWGIWPEDKLKKPSTNLVCYHAFSKIPTGPISWCLYSSWNEHQCLTHLLCNIMKMIMYNDYITRRITLNDNDNDHGDSICHL